MSGRRLVLLRHGRTAWNVVDRAQGHAEVELDETGHAQARTAARALAGLGPAALWTSDLSRARQSAAYLEEATGLVATPDARLREYDLGVREGLTNGEFASRFPAEHASWFHGDGSLLVAGAESVAAAAERMVTVLRECLAGLGSGETGVAVSHGGALKPGLVGLLGWPDSLRAQLRGMDNCAWTVLAEREYDGRLRLAAYNCRCAP